VPGVDLYHKPKHIYKLQLNTRLLDPRTQRHMNLKMSLPPVLKAGSTSLDDIHYAVVFYVLTFKTPKYIITQTKFVLIIINQIKAELKKFKENF